MGVPGAGNRESVDKFRVLPPLELGKNPGAIPLAVRPEAAAS